jgi:hypothetical protein
MVSSFHGIALRTMDGQIIWGHGSPNLEFTPGIHEIEYAISTLPLRPGSYQWLVSLYDEGGLVDLWECEPPLLVATKPVNRAVDNWSGILNPTFDISFTSSPHPSDSVTNEVYHASSANRS